LQPGYLKSLNEDSAHNQPGSIASISTSLHAPNAYRRISPSRRSTKETTINGVTYEGVTEFIYLGTLISNDISVEKERQRRILTGNRTYFVAISLCVTVEVYPEILKLYFFLIFQCHHMSLIDFMVSLPIVAEV
jgi:hypothetical protein